VALKYQLPDSCAEIRYLPISLDLSVFQEHKIAKAAQKGRSDFDEVS
jgi:hypothetical protein